MRTGQRPLSCVQSVIPQELEQIAVELIGTGFGHYFHLGRTASVLGGKVRRLDLYFLDGVDRNRDVSAPELTLVVVGAVQTVRNVPCIASVDIERRHPIAL